MRLASHMLHVDLVGTGSSRLLIDTGEGRADYIEVLEKAMHECGCARIEQIIVTHWHHDHLGGVPSVQAKFGPDIPVRKYMCGCSEVKPGGKGELAIDPFSIWPEKKFVPLHDGEMIRTEGATLKVLHTPGHANDHVSLILEEENAMFTADNVLGIGTAVFVDLAEYLRSLQKMLAERPGRLYCGHGPPVTAERGQDRLREYIAHRMARVRQVETVLRAGDYKQPGRAWQVEEVTAKVLF